MTGNERLTEMCNSVKMTNHIQLSGVLHGWGFSNSPGGQKPLEALKLTDLLLIMKTSLENCQYPFILKKELNLERSIFAVSYRDRDELVICPPSIISAITAPTDMQ